MQQVKHLTCPEKKGIIYILILGAFSFVLKNIMELYFSLSGLFNALSSTVLGILVYSKNRRNQMNQTFALFCLSVAVWSYPYTMWPLVKTSQETLLWFQLLHIGASFASITYLHFVAVWLGIYEKIKKIILIGYGFGFFFASLTFSKLFISGIVPKYSMRFWAEPGPLYHFYLIYFFGYAIYSSYLLIINYKNTIGAKRSQAKFILIGIALSFIGGSTNYPLWYNINFPPYGNILASSYVILSAYAIIAHRLMDIKLVMRRYLVFLASLSVVLVLATSMKYIFDSWFYNFSSWGDPLILVAALFIFPPIKDRFYHIANKYFFSSLYDSSEVIATLSEKLRSTLEAEKIYGYIFDTLSSAFHAKAIGILTYSEKTKKYIINYNNGFNTGGQQEFDEDKKLNEIYIKRNRTIITDDIKTQFKNNKTLGILLKLGVEILTPLNVKDKTIGLIALGAKESGDMYNEEDLKVLEVVGAQTAIALENALLYKETKNFSVKMEKEVEKATRDLRKANVQLKKLDAAKSEFISIASHQLRTPLTVIKGYISMMLEGNFGALTKPETESLEKVFLSNERLIQLVENLLNVSRIESGRLQFDFKQIDLNNMVASVVEELSGNAKKKNLILQYKPPAEPLPKFKLDEEKIRQVVMNLIDNGLKYTKQGSITIKLELVNNKVKFSVADSGMGIRPEDMGNLFKKFSRGTGTSLIHTEGTGLGLYVARMMVEAHHGKIWAESDGEGKGSRFCFELPIK